MSNALQNPHTFKLETSCTAAKVAVTDVFKEIIKKLLISEAVT